MILGFRLKELRNNKGISQEQLAFILGVSKVSVCGYENGTRYPSLKVILKILDLFNVSADYLFGRELNVICEEEGNYSLIMSQTDIKILNEIHNNQVLYYKIAKNPERFFSKLCKKEK